MTILLPNYIIKQIIEYLINNLLINNKKYNDNNYFYSTKRYYLYINEILKYSIISKSWFEIISLLISNHIIDNDIIEKWIEIENNNNNEKPIINKKYKKNSNNNNNISKTNFKIIYKQIIGKLSIDKNKIYINNKFSIIKINESTLNDYFNNHQFNQTIIVNPNNPIIENYQDLDKYKKFILKILTNDSPGTQNQSLLNELFEIQEYLKNKNNEINLNLKLFCNNLILSQGDDDDNASNNSNSKIIINNLEIIGKNDLKLTFENIFKYIQANNIIILNRPNLNNVYQEHIIGLNLIFNSELNLNIKSIKIQSDEHISPMDLIEINQLKYLQSLSISFDIHEIMKSIIHNNNKINNNTTLNSNIISHCHKYKFIEKNNDNLKYYWDLLFENLGRNKSIKNLTLKNFCNLGLGCFLDYYSHFTKEYNDPFNLVCNGICNLLTNNQTIQHLKLVDFDFLDPKIALLPLLTNSNSIKSLLIKYTLKYGINKDVYKNDKIYPKLQFEIISFLISKVFTSKNNSITHFQYFEGYQLDYLFRSFFNLIIENQNKINKLYSINILIDEMNFENALNYIKLIKSPSCSIKEINLIISRYCRIETGFNESILLKSKQLNNTYTVNSNQITINIIKYLKFK